MRQYNSVYVLQQSPYGTTFSIQRSETRVRPCIIAFTRPSDAHQFKALYENVEHTERRPYHPIAIVRINQEDLYSSCAVGCMDLAIYTHSHKIMLLEPETELFNHRLHFEMLWDGRFC